MTPPPVPDLLLPPLLSLLPSSLTPSLPTSLLPLLTPILRNRLKLLTTPTSPWALLLTWNSTHATHLHQHLSTVDLCSPASGILLGFLRLDAETLKAAVEIPDLGLVVVYLWSPNDPDGEDDDWRILDVVCAEDIEGDWYDTIDAAEKKFSSSSSSLSGTQTNGSRTLAPLGVSLSSPPPAEEDDEDDYWAQYDRSSAATPAVREENQMPEEDYFKMYDDVTPALDGPSPYGPTSAPGLEGYADTGVGLVYPAPLGSGSPRHSDAHSDAEAEAAKYSPITSTTTSTPPTTYSAPHALSPSHSHSHSPSLSATASGMHPSDLVRKMEESASLQTQMETAVKQHVATSVKSLYRLAKVSGIGREEFTELVNMELQVLEMLDEDE
ncbi:hypothetical protein BZA77DRAFT_310876 [Pyronema omphalodes]|nr:hypothetical protein BZA77DRAFT_310876 [Pyronema omphalodes]